MRKQFLIRHMARNLWALLLRKENVLRTVYNDWCDVIFCGNIIRCYKGVEINLIKGIGSLT
jgi:hypothetical protein